MTLEELIEGFHPEENDVDSKLLCFITGREVNDCMIEWRRSDFDEFGDNILPDDEDNPGDDAFGSTVVPFAQSRFSQK